MYTQIKLLADEALSLQNKDRMDAALREISAVCDTIIAGGGDATGEKAPHGAQAEPFAESELIVNGAPEPHVDAVTPKPKKGGAK